LAPMPGRCPRPISPTLGLVLRRILSARRSSSPSCTSLTRPSPIGNRFILNGSPAGPDQVVIASSPADSEPVPIAAGLPVRSRSRLQLCHLRLSRRRRSSTRTRSPWHHRQTRRDALQGLNAGHLVDGDRAIVVIGAGGGLVDPADVRTFVVEGGIGLRGQPVPDAVRLEVGLFFKNRPTERCEMLGTSPRRMASSAISRWLQWLIGRSLSDGFSHVIATAADSLSSVDLRALHRRKQSTDNR
jgi:hypothetical protein